MTNPKKEEKAPENNKPKQTAYLVCEGALCKCDAGAKPSKLKVTSHQKAVINDNKLAATVMDITFDPPTTPFVTCAKKPGNDKTCTPAFVKWDKPYNDIDVLDNKIITDKSELLCNAFGGKVTVVMHGQTQKVNSIQAENQDKKIVTQVNALADPVKSNKKEHNVSVSSIKGEVVPNSKYESVNSQKDKTVQSASKATNDVPDLYLRPGQEVKFTANYKNTGSLVSWKLNLSEKEPYYFIQHGPEYVTSFPEVGKYRIEAYGTGGDGIFDTDTKINDKGETEIRNEDSTCTLEILVQQNHLKGLKYIDSENVISVGTATKSDVQARAGVPITFEPVYTMPPTKDEVVQLNIVVKDASGAELYRTVGEGVLVYTPENSGAEYFVEAYLQTDATNKFSQKFRTVKNSVSVIATSGMKEEHGKIRPGTKLTFTVSEYKFKGAAPADIIAKENELINWYENNEKPVFLGKSYSKTYEKEGKYTVICAVTTAKATWFTEKKDQRDDWRFEVTRNYPTAIEQKTPGRIKVNKMSSFELKGIFDINIVDESTIHWQLTGPENKEQKGIRFGSFVFSKKGKYVLTASMNGKSTKIDIECIECEIIEGYWTDSDGNVLAGNEEDPTNTIAFAGWGQEVCAAFKYWGLEGESLTLEVWDSDWNGDECLLKKDITISPRTDLTMAFVSFKLDKTLQERVLKESMLLNANYGSLYFKIKSKNGLKIINDGVSLPLKSNAYLNVDEKIRMKAYFADNNDYKRYSTAALDTPVYMQFKSTNLIDVDLEVEIWKKTDDDDAKVGTKRSDFKVDKYGMASLKLNMKLVKIELPKPNDVVQIYMKVFKKGATEELYSSGKSFLLTVYQTLKTDPAAIGTTKAFVTVDSSNTEYGSCGKKYCIRVGEKSELIREINIRLAGFGGNVPSDEFTGRTEQMIKQFQRDYMKVAATGKICGDVLKAIDEFSSKFDINDTFWKQLKCSCDTKGEEATSKLRTIKELNNCTGFGDHTGKGTYKVGNEEKNHKYEYPGMHRSLLFGLKALQFYFGEQTVYKIDLISSGYRCRFKNYATTNHQGKAIDIQFSKGSWEIRGRLYKNVSELVTMRNDIFAKYLNAKTNWSESDNYGMEPIGLNTDNSKIDDNHTYSWIHLDVREFKSVYLEDKYFCKDKSTLNGKKIIALANELGYTKTCNCMPESSALSNVRSDKKERVDPKTLKTSEKGIQFIKDWESFKPNLYNDDSEGKHCTIGYGHLVHRGPCDGSESEEFKKGITKERATELFKERLKEFEMAVQNDIKVPLYQYEFDALVSLLFNSGSDFLNSGGKKGGETQIKKKINNKEYGAGADEMADVTNGGLSGLVKRRKAEINMFKSDVYDSTH